MPEVAFTKVKAPFGWLGNMSPHPIDYQGKRWRTSEALFQALRFPASPEGEAIQEAIREQASPMAAKFVAKRHKAQRVVEPASAQDLENMRLMLRLKIKQHEDLRRKLLATGDDLIIEDCSRRRASPWGAKKTAAGWEGQNLLGQLWMELRTEVRNTAGVK